MDSIKEVKGVKAGNTNWEKINPPLNEQILKHIKELGYETMTPVQSSCIPLFRRNRDVAVQAVTGSGKTLGFIIPLLEILLKRSERLKEKQVGSIIISPTRELATQIYEVLDGFLKHLPQFTSKLLVGGCPVQEDIKYLFDKGANIIIATPGRLVDLLERSESGLSLGVKSLEFLVLDEADKLLDLGFTAALNTILSKLPRQRRTGLFSATQTHELKELVRAGLRNPATLTVTGKNIEGTDEASRTPDSLLNYYMACPGDQKLRQLIAFIKQKIKEKSSKFIIFFSTCACVEYFVILLSKFIKDIPVFSIHGKMHDKRYKVFDSFRNADKGMLVCTDVMARGVDIPLVDWVIQFDPPSSASAFVHRCGRTARIGREGSAVIMLLPNEEDYVRFLRINQKVVLEYMKLIDNTPDIFEEIRNLNKSDRAIFDKGNRAFVSYIQSYGKHECNLLLRVRDLDFAALAKCFGLLKMPKMPELKRKKIEFEEDPIDTNTIGYKDNQREASRQRKFVEYKQSGSWPGKRKRLQKEGSWSQSKKLRANKEDIKSRKKQEIKESKKRKRVKLTQEDLDELAKDVALLKKFKNKKMSNKEFDKQFVGDDDD